MREKQLRERLFELTESQAYGGFLLVDQILTLLRAEIERCVLTDEERGKVFIPCETCDSVRNFGSVQCLECVVQEHAKAQRNKILKALEAE